MLKNRILLLNLKKKYPKVTFKKNIYLEFSHNITFEGSAYIGPEAYWSAKGKIVIGNNVIFGPKTILWTYSHNYNSTNFIPYGSQEEDIVKEIVIKDNVWIGLGATILPGVTIEEGAIIGMHAVITKNVPYCAIMVGNPAKIVKYRDKTTYENLKENNKLYLNNKSVLSS